MIGRVCVRSSPEKQSVLLSNNNRPLCSTRAAAVIPGTAHVEPLLRAHSLPTLNLNWNCLRLFPTHWLELCFSSLLASLISVLNGWLDLLGLLEPVTFLDVFIFLSLPLSLSFTHTQRQRQRDRQAEREIERVHNVERQTSSVFCYFSVCTW